MNARIASLQQRGTSPYSSEVYGCEFWYHTACEKVEPKVYEFLCGNEDVKSLQWYCKRCSVTHLTVIKAILSMQAAQRKLEEKMDLVLSTMNDKNLVIDSLHEHAEKSGKDKLL